MNEDGNFFSFSSYPSTYVNNSWTVYKERLGLLLNSLVIIQWWLYLKRYWNILFSTWILISTGAEETVCWFREISISFCVAQLWTFYGYDLKLERKTCKLLHNCHLNVNPFHRFFLWKLSERPQWAYMLSIIDQWQKWPMYV